MKLKKGLDVGVSELLTNLRFADDVILVTDSKKGMQTMLEDSAGESARPGLHLHPDKSKVVTNSIRATSETLKVLYKSRVSTPVPR